MKEVKPFIEKLIIIILSFTKEDLSYSFWQLFITIIFTTKNIRKTETSKDFLTSREKSSLLSILCKVVTNSENNKKILSIYIMNLS